MNFFESPGPRVREPCSCVFDSALLVHQVVISSYMLSCCARPQRVHTLPDIIELIKLVCVILILSGILRTIRMLVLVHSKLDGRILRLHPRHTILNALLRLLHRTALKRRESLKLVPALALDKGISMIVVESRRSFERIAARVRLTFQVLTCCELVLTMSPGSVSALLWSILSRVRLSVPR